VNCKEGSIEDGETLEMNYGNLTALLTKVIQEQQVEIYKLRLKINVQKNAIEFFV